jgi:hypothetical protein
VDKDSEKWRWEMMKKSVPAAAVVFLVLLLPGILMCQPLEQVIDQKIIFRAVTRLRTASGNSSWT